MMNPAVIVAPDAAAEPVAAADDADDADADDVPDVEAVVFVVADELAHALRASPPAATTAVSVQRGARRPKETRKGMERSFLKMGRSGTGEIRCETARR
jgi:hypothetical protein